MRVIYNGVDLMVVETYVLDMESVYDDTTTDYLYTRVTIAVKAVVNGLAEVVNSYRGGQQAGAAGRNQGLAPPGPFMSYSWGTATFPPPPGQPLVFNPLATTRNRPPQLASKFATPGALGGPLGAAMFTPTTPPGTGLDRGVPTGAGNALRSIRVMPNHPGLTHEVVRHRLSIPRRKLWIFTGPGVEGGGVGAGSEGDPAPDGKAAAKAAATAEFNKVFKDPPLGADPPGGPAGGARLTAGAGAALAAARRVLDDPNGGARTEFGKAQQALLGLNNKAPTTVKQLLGWEASPNTRFGNRQEVLTVPFLDSPQEVDQGIDGVPKVTPPCDCKNGPTPKVWAVEAAVGDAGTMFVTWSCVTYINEARLNYTQDVGALISNRFSQTHEIDASGYTTVTTEGRALFRTDWVYALPESPDHKRPLIFMPIPPGFVRENIVVQGLEDASGVRYRYQDRQVPVNFVAGPYARAASISVVHRQAVSTNADVLGGALSFYERTLGLRANKHIAKGGFTDEEDKAIRAGTAEALKDLADALKGMKKGP